MHEVRMLIHVHVCTYVRMYVHIHGVHGVSTYLVCVCAPARCVQAVSSITGVPVSALDGEEAKLLSLADELHK